MILIWAGFGRDSVGSIMGTLFAGVRGPMVAVALTKERNKVEDITCFL